MEPGRQAVDAGEHLDLATTAALGEPDVADHRPGRVAQRRERALRAFSVTAHTIGAGVDADAAVKGSDRSEGCASAAEHQAGEDEQGGSHARHGDLLPMVDSAGNYPSAAASRPPCSLGDLSTAALTDVVAMNLAPAAVHSQSRECAWASPIISAGRLP
jgi:hypothetical protein